MNKFKLSLGDDQPKTNPWQHDLLGYRPFAERMARVIVGLDAPNGYVIGLHGRWGSGKSTALNFIQAFIQKHNAELESDEDRVTIIDFRPWMVSGHRDLIAAFFKILSESLCPSDTKKKRFVNRLCFFAGSATDELVDAAAKVALLVDPSGGVASRVAGAAAKATVNEMVKGFLEDPSLQKAYEDLKEKLAQESKRFIVIIDDLDRLEAEEIRSIAQMVKTVGRLPHVIYVLAYDREIVWRSLDDEPQRGGPRYAEKIVQQEIELPKPSRNALLSILDQEIGFLEGETGNSLRWHYILRYGVHRWVQSPRDVLRLSNAVKFSWPALAGEIDPQDLLAMEGVRLFDEAAYYWVRENRDFIFGEGIFQLALEGVREAAIEALRERLPNDCADQIFQLFGVLFPTARNWFDASKSVSKERSADLGKRRGIGSEAGYDAYFSLHPSTDEVAKVEIDRLILHLEDSEYLLAALTSFLGKKNSRDEPMIGKVLQELRFRFESHGGSMPTESMLNVLLEIGEETIATDWSGEMFTLSPRAHWGFLIDSMLGRWGEKEAGKKLVSAFKSASSASACADVFVSRGRELGIFDTESKQPPLISRVHFDELGKILLAMIHRSLKSDSLLDAPFYFDIVRSWSYLEGSEPAKRWLENGMRESARFLAKVGKGLLSYSTSDGSRSYTFRSLPDPNLYDLEIIMFSAQRHKNDSRLSEDERRMIAELERGAKEFLSRGKSEEGEPL